MINRGRNEILGFLGALIVIFILVFLFYKSIIFQEESPKPLVKENNIEDDNSLWITTTTENDITFQYPQEILADYISGVEWPPELRVEDKLFVCNQSGDEVQLGGQTELRLVDSRSYCVTKESEGAAGSTYTSYTYEFPQDNQTGAITFTLRFVECQNYDEPKASECESEQSALDIDGIVDRIVKSIKSKSEF